MRRRYRFDAELNEWIGTDAQHSRSEAADTVIVVSGKALNKDAKSAGATAFFGNPTNLTK
jgi:hypothetical protein